MTAKAIARTRRNVHIHRLYVRHEHDACLALIEEVLAEYCDDESGQCYGDGSAVSGWRSYASGRSPLEKAGRPCAVPLSSL